MSVKKVLKTYFKINFFNFYFHKLKNFKFWLGPKQKKNVAHNLFYGGPGSGSSHEKSSFVFSLHQHFVFPWW